MKFNLIWLRCGLLRRPKNLDKMKNKITSISLAIQSVFTERMLLLQQKRVIAIERLSKLIDKLLKNTSYT